MEAPVDKQARHQRQSPPERAYAGACMTEQSTEHQGGPRGARMSPAPEQRALRRAACPRPRALAAHLEAQRHGGPGEGGHGARVLERVRKVRAAARVPLRLHHARPHGAREARRLQVEHVDRRRDRRQPRLRARRPPHHPINLRIACSQGRPASRASAATQLGRSASAALAESRVHRPAPPRAARRAPGRQPQSTP